MVEVPKYENCQNIADLVRQCEKAQAALVLLKLPNGTVSMITAGFESHADANNVLSLGIHMNLKQHDEFVLAGAAGEEAQVIAQEIEAANV
jgi:hypothetical protein